MTCPIKHALDQCQLALGRVQQRQPQAGYTFTAAYEAISAARAELARRTPPAESLRLAQFLMNMQTRLGSCREACGDEASMKAWDDYSLAAAALTAPKP